MLYRIMHDQIMCNKRVANTKSGFTWTFQEDLYPGKNYVHIITASGIKKKPTGFSQLKTIKGRTYNIFNTLD